ncbi:hypothetical protein NQZ79_g4728 [Umbelopsis isabellina]|nr:hypothetical protein NQZ79_g4728 [Umbelopsis isabellina]
MDMFSKGSTSTFKDEASTLDLSQQYSQSGSSGQVPSIREPLESQSNPAINDEWSAFTSESNAKAPYATGGSYFQSMPYASNMEQLNPDDASMVFDILNSPNYTDLVYSSTPCTPISRTPTSAQHSNQYLANLLEAEDIVPYLSQATYTDDVYELPMYVQDLIMQAKEEVVTNDSKPENDKKARSAIDRLRMLREHLLIRSGGDVMQASTAANINKLTQDEMELYWNGS